MLRCMRKGRARVLVGVSAVDHARIRKAAKAENKSMTRWLSDVFEQGAKDLLRIG